MDKDCHAVLANALGNIFQTTREPSTTATIPALLHKYDRRKEEQCLEAAAAAVWERGGGSPILFASTVAMTRVHSQASIWKLAELRTNQIIAAVHFYHLSEGYST